MKLGYCVLPLPVLKRDDFLFVNKVMSAILVNPSLPCLFLLCGTNASYHSAGWESGVIPCSIRKSRLGRYYLWGRSSHS